MAARRGRTEVELRVEEQPGPHPDLGAAPPLPPGPKPASPKARVRWALRFLRLNLEDSHKRDRDYEPIRLEAASLFGLPFKVSTADLLAAQRTLREFQDQAVKDDVLEFNVGTRPETLIVSLGRGRSAGVQIYRVQRGRWERIVLGVLDAMQAIGPLLRLCGEPGCRKLFLVKHVREFLCAPHAAARQARREVGWHRAQRKRDRAWEAYRRKHPNAQRRPRIVAPRSVAR